MFNHFSSFIMHNFIKNASFIYRATKHAKHIFIKVYFDVTQAITLHPLVKLKPITLEFNHPPLTLMKWVNVLLMKRFRRALPTKVPSTFEMLFVESVAGLPLVRAYKG